MYPVNTIIVNYKIFEIRYLILITSTCSIKDTNTSSLKVPSPYIKAYKKLIMQHYIIKVYYKNKK